MRSISLYISVYFFCFLFYFYLSYRLENMTHSMWMHNWWHLNLNPNGFLFCFFFGFLVYVKRKIGWMLEWLRDHINLFCLLFVLKRDFSMNESDQTWKKKNNNKIKIYQNFLGIFRRFYAEKNKSLLVVYHYQSKMLHVWPISINQNLITDAFSICLLRFVDFSTVFFLLMLFLLLLFVCSFSLSQSQSFDFFVYLFVRVHNFVLLSYSQKQWTGIVHY